MVIRSVRFALAGAIVGSDTHYHAGVAVARKAIERMRAAHAQGQLRIAANEIAWFDNLQDALDELPEDEDAFVSQQLALADRSRFLPKEYGLET